jgi:hypothetical protein
MPTAGSVCVPMFMALSLPEFDHSGPVADGQQRSDLDL